MQNHRIIKQDTFPGVAVAQFRSFAKKMPAYYFSVATMMLATTYVFYGVASPFLSVGIPGFATLLSGWRAVWWVRHQNDALSDAQAKAYLHRATGILVVATAVVIAMDAALFRSGNVDAKYFVLFQMLASAMSGFYCLMQLRSVALAMAIAVIGPFFWLMVSMGHASNVAAAANTVVTAFVMVLAMLGYQRDFTNLILSKAEAANLHHENLRLANLDMLTDLPNRRQFFDVLDRSHQTAMREKSRMAVGLIDLDGFKPVNDTRGHRVGDVVLSKVAARLRSEELGLTEVCRVGGDEFAFIVMDVVTDQQLEELGRSIIKMIDQPIIVDYLVTSVGCSVGFAVYPQAGDTADVLYERADYALYHAKRTGRSRAVLFSEEHARLIKEQGIVEQTLRGANLEAEFYPMFQPIVDAQSRRTLAFEALARWKSPVLGDVPPYSFIPIAEQAGIITDLTPVLLRKALKEAVGWSMETHLSFNVSPYDIASLENTVNIIRIIRESGIDPQRVAIEITETALVQNFVQTNTHITMLRKIGVKISLDDFGTGYSSLSYIRALPLDKIKVDRSFIQDIGTNPSSRSIVRFLISLCNDMGLACVIEGVETEDQLATLVELGGRVIQGFYFSRPMLAEEARHYIASASPATEAS